MGPVREDFGVREIADQYDTRVCNFGEWISWSPPRVHKRRRLNHPRSKACAKTEAVQLASPLPTSTTMSTTAMMSTAPALRLAAATNGTRAPPPSSPPACAPRANDPPHAMRVTRPPPRRVSIPAAFRLGLMFRDAATVVAPRPRPFRARRPPRPPRDDATAFVPVPSNPSCAPPPRR